ncbi:MAG: plastocyanin/azurin family copper-binding protein [Solirubrobacterales bacterium]|nr:plastocyanin/azurin family copper-binding protein [Solirubrobacterales bacterium]
MPLAVGALAFAGCGSSSDDSSSSTESASTGTTTEQPAETGGAATGQESAKGVLDIAADPGGQLAYEPDKLDGKSGKVTVDFTNDSPLPHDIVFDSPDGKEVAKTSVFTGGSEKATFDAKPGAYTFYCSVPGHREGGMEGTLTVK